MKKYIIGLTLCGIAGGLASHFGGLGALCAVTIGQIGMLIYCV